ncbi:MAG: efflux RND transporter periplasmic adaptor subunit [Alphaproteobacteria bacterium]|nr:efflux RND transporter periplasmic adaptor subunit [Alphaproteobacteria bacterium]
MAAMWAAARRNMAKPWAIALGLVVLGLVAWALFFRGDGDRAPYQTAEVDRGRITQVVSATGKLEPLVTVNVGSTVSGPVQAVEVDFNSTVRAGQVLARLDPETFRQRVVQAQAQVASARASLQQAQANRAQAAAEFQRYQRLSDEGFASDQLMLQQRTARDAADASVNAARASVAQAEAALAQARVDLERSIIRAPIDGVVVDRQVDPGQSVAASFQAPTLFLIAQDLSRLQANITVDEADIGNVREGLPVRFTVDAYPDQEFDGVVSQVRQQGVDTNGVVSYTVVVQADNPGRRLLPGMTANAEIVVAETQEVARLPNAALRFRPGDPALAARGQALTSGGAQQSGAGEARAQSTRGGRSGGQAVERIASQLDLSDAQRAQAQEAFRAAMTEAGPPPGQDAAPGERRAFMRRVRQDALARLESVLTDAQKARLQEMHSGAAEAEPQTRRAVVWVLRNGAPAPVGVTLGVADQSHTQIVSGLDAGDQVIIGGGPEGDARQRQQQQRGGPPGMRIRGA